MSVSVETGGRHASDILAAQPKPLDAFFTPRAVAVLGATEAPGSVGRALLENLIGTPFGGTIFPVNPKRPSVLGIKAYPSIAAVPVPVDLAVLATPAPTIPDLVDECIAAGVRAAVIISAGFKETGPEGLALEERIGEQVRHSKLRLIGPNSLGVMCPRSGLNATFAAAMARPGNVAFLSQSGALLTAILDWSLQTNVGFSAFFSLGSMLDVGWGDLIDHLGDDPHTHSIVLYMESIGNARSFLSAARAVAQRKPVIVLKAGRTEAAAKAAASHTGALPGSDEVLDAAFRRTGVLRVGSIDDLFSMAEVLGKQPRPRGPRLTILTNAGGPGVLATDSLLTNGGELAQLSPPTREALEALLPPPWSHHNPIDVLSDAGPDRYARAVEIAVKDPASDGLLVILTPQAMTDPTRTAEQLEAHAHGTGKPILASWMGGAGVAAGRAILNQADIPTFAYPDTAARAFTFMWRYSYNLRGLYETPYLPSGPEEGPDRAGAQHILAAALQSGQTLLSEHESRQMLAAYHIPIGQPTCKLDGYELILGSSIDPQLGPVLLFGAGGPLAEVFKDRALALPLLNTTLARRLMEQTRIYTALKGVSGRKPVDLAALELLLVRFSHLVVEQPRIKEIDVNPLLASPEGLLALDARVVLFGPEVPDEQLPQPVIRPYPMHYVQPWRLKDGSPVLLRPIRPEDEPLLVKLHEKLSEQSVYLRYFHSLKLSQRVAHERLSRLCFIDYDREMALVVDRRSPETGTHDIIAIARLIKEPGTRGGEWGMLVGDSFQAQGVGTRLLQQLVQVAREEKLHSLRADVLPQNRGMLRVCEKLGFHLRHDAAADLVRAEMEI